MATWIVCLLKYIWKAFNGPHVMAQQVNVLAAKPDHLHLILGVYGVDRENQFQQVILWLQSACYTYLYLINQSINTILNFILWIVILVSLCESYVHQGKGTPKPWRGHWIPWSWSCKHLWATCHGCCEPFRSSMRAVYILNHWTISLALICPFHRWENGGLACLTIFPGSQI